MTKRSRIQRLTSRLKRKVKRTKALGVAANPNSLIKRPTFKDELKGDNKIKRIKVKPNDKRDNLEAEASKPGPKRYRYGVEMSKFCAYLITKHGEDYQAMQRDPKNHYQKSAGELKRMIANFKKFKVTSRAFELASKECDQEMETKTETV